MKPGYLFLQTHPEHPGLVRCLTQDKLPSTTGEAGAAVRYIARFKDIEAAQMHVHNALRRSLVDIDEHLYRVELAQALAAVETDELSHERVWIDASLNSEERRRIESLSEDYRSKRRYQDLFWRSVGAFALAMLVLGLLGVF